VVQFRKSKKFGGARFTLGKRGLSSSVGGGPFRLSFGSDRKVRRTIRAPGVGLWDTKVIGGGRRRRGGGGFFKFVGFVVIGLVLWVSCDISAEKERVAKDSVPWTSGPTDGEWFEAPWNETVVPFGQTSQPGSSPWVAQFTYRIDSPPELKTPDDGKTVVMTSRVSVTRVGGDESEIPLLDYQGVIFARGADDPSYSYDEASGLGADVNCQPDRLNVGQSAVCTVSFTTRGVEIENSHWVFGGYAMGTWPSQGAVAAAS
jgi:hypothetical protein